MSRVTDADLPKVVQDAWAALLRTRDPVASIHQTPAYFAYLRDSLHASGDEPAPALFALHDRHQDAIAGVVAVRQSHVDLPFSVRGRTFFRLRLRSVAVIGSDPLVREDPTALALLFTTLAAAYPASQVIDLHSIRRDSFLWRRIDDTSAITDEFQVHVMGGFQATHSVAVPASLAAYDAMLSRKRRYNYRRQARRLADHLGAPLQLEVIERPDQVPTLLAAIDALRVPRNHTSLLRQEEYATAARHGVLCCFVLRADRQVVGFAVGLQSARGCLVHRLFTMRGLKPFSPGTTLWQAILRQVIEDGRFRCIGLGYGQPAYDFRATNAIEQRGRVLLCRPGLGSRARLRAHAAYGAAVQATKARITRMRSGARSIAGGGTLITATCRRAGSAIGALRRRHVAAIPGLFG